MMFLPYVELPGDFCGRRLCLDAAVEVDVSALEDRLGRDGQTQGELHTGSI